MTVLRIGLLCLMLAAGWGPLRADPPNLLANPGFEDPLEGTWGGLWTRDPDVGAAQRVSPGRSGEYCLHVTHTGAQDWAMWQTARLSVAVGDIFQLSGWIKCADVAGETNLSVVTFDAEGQVLNWIFGPARTQGTHDWQEVRTHFVIPEGCAAIQVRIIGWGPGEMWFDDLSLTKEGNLIDIRGPAQDIPFGNDLLDVVFNTGTSTFTVTDRRTDQVYEQLPLSELPIVMGATPRPDGRGLTAEMWFPATDLHFELRLETPTAAPEVRCDLSGLGPLEPFPFPAPFRPRPGDFLVIPLNEGIIYPADDADVDPLWLVGYSGHGISMRWFGQSQGEYGPGVMAIIHTPDDMRVHLQRPREGGNTLLCAWPVWEPSRFEWAYDRAATYVFLESGGYVSQAKRYREYARNTGLYKSLADKLAENPAVDLLIGAVNVWAPVWYGNTDPVALVDEMQSLGIERILFSEGSTPDVVAALNERPGVLTSRYDIYQDVWPPGEPEWANHEGWPDDLVLKPDGTILEGWVIRDGDTLYPGGVICSPRGLARAREQIPADLATTPYRCRFLDTTTASPWRECYHPEHPTTRGEDRHWKMELLRFCSEELGLVTGSETGLDASVPYLHYFEGMMSLGPYRLPDCGYTLIDYKEPTEDFLKYQVGSYYRVPLWELVYHDCTVSYWYWGDSTNKAPEVWGQRDLLNILYGTPPLFMLSPEVWDRHRERFVQTYRDVCPLVRRLGYDEMLSHEFLTDDHTLQRTNWSSGISVVANFSSQEHSLANGTPIRPLGYLAHATPFTDVPWDHWALADILACVHAGIVAGYPDSRYRPAITVSRDQMAVYISRSLAGGDAGIPPGPSEPTFPDVPADHWAFRHIEYAAANDIVRGYDDGSYRPEYAVDRGQMAVFVARAIVTPTGEAGLADYEPAGVTFPDVTPDTDSAWCWKYIEYLVEHGVVRGYDDGRYHPEYTCSRDQMAVYVTRAFELGR